MVAVVPAALVPMRRSAQVAGNVWPLANPSVRIRHVAPMAAMESVGVAPPADIAPLMGPAPATRNAMRLGSVATMAAAGIAAPARGLRPFVIRTNTNVSASAPATVSIKNVGMMAAAGSVAAVQAQRPSATRVRSFVNLNAPQLVTVSPAARMVAATPAENARKRTPAVTTIRANVFAYRSAQKGKSAVMMVVRGPVARVVTRGKHATTRTNV
jgi:hypothetical protein